MIGFLMRLGLSERFAKVALVMLAFAALGAALWWLRSDAYSDGQRAERAAWELKAAEMKAQAEALQRHADVLLNAAAALDATRIAANRQEVDDAISNIPDQSTSARQRARACLELRRQGKGPPACEPQPAG